MVELLAAGAVGVGHAGRLLADLHRRLHALPPRRSHHTRDRIRHLDLHPDEIGALGRAATLVADAFGSPDSARRR